MSLMRDGVKRVASRGAEVGRSAATKGAEVGRSAATKGAEVGRNMARLDVPWARWAPARAAREAILGTLGLMMNFYTRLRAIGTERFETLQHPVIFAANHNSHLDTPTILRALPRKWRQRTAVAAAADYFYKSRATAYFVALSFNTVPLMRNGGGAGDGATKHVDKLIDRRWNLLMFPEGTRSRDGRIGKVRSGAALLAARHEIAIVPVYVKGTHDAMPPGQSWPKRIPGRFISRRHRLDVHFGPPVFPRYGEDRADVMKRVRAFWDSEGGTKPVSAPAPERAPKPARPPLAPAA